MAPQAFLIAYLLAASMTDEVNLSVSPIHKLVDYRYDFSFSELIPGMRYETSVNASWAIPQSALSGLEGQRITVKISGTADNESGIYFRLPLGSQSKTTEAYLYCDVQNKSCSNTSVLSAVIPLSITAGQNDSGTGKLSFKSEIVAGTQFSLPEAPDLGQSASGLLDSFRDTFAANLSNVSAGSGLFPNHSGNTTGNFLDTLRPEGDSKNPLEFLRQNPLISIAALAIVVVITGAYLLNAKD